MRYNREFVMSMKEKLDNFIDHPAAIKLTGAAASIYIGGAALAAGSEAHKRGEKFRSRYAKAAGIANLAIGAWQMIDAIGGSADQATVASLTEPKELYEQAESDDHDVATTMPVVEVVGMAREIKRPLTRPSEL